MKQLITIQFKKYFYLSGDKRLRNFFLITAVVFVFISTLTYIIFHESNYESFSNQQTLFGFSETCKNNHLNDINISIRELGVICGLLFLMLMLSIKVRRLINND